MDLLILIDEISIPQFYFPPLINKKLYH